MNWGIRDYAKIEEAGSAARRADNKATRVESKLNQLRRHLDCLSLASQAMWELIRDRTEFTEEDLETKILEVDGRDGTVDGKISMRIEVCGSCGRNTNSRREVCVMCGAPLEREHKFE